MDDQMTSSPLSYLPRWISRWLGYRVPISTKLPLPVTLTRDNEPLNWRWREQFQLCFWTFVASFSAMAIIQAVFAHAEYFISKGVPAIFASFGSSAVLIYGAIESPYAQPRALLGGQFIGALTGICFMKLIHLLPTEEQFLQLEWLGGSLSCATSIVLMQLTGTLHPPGGATALLATVNPDVRELGWYFLPVILLTSVLALAVALFINNIQRRYPTFWFTPDNPHDAAVIPLPSTKTMSDPFEKSSAGSASSRIPQNDSQIAEAKTLQEPSKAPMTPSLPPDQMV